MSGKVMGAVWDLDLPHSKQLVLLAMADHAHHDGTQVFASAKLIAWKTGYSVRQTQRIIDQLESDGLIKLTSPATPRMPPIYRIDVSVGKKKPEYQGRHFDTPDGSEGRQNVTSKNDQGRHFDDSGVTKSAIRGDIAMSPKPDQPLKEEPKDSFAFASNDALADSQIEFQNSNPDLQESEIPPQSSAKVPPAWRPGDLAAWTHVMRGGYGWQGRYNCVVLKVNPSKVTILVEKKNGEREQRHVAPKNLSPRSDTAPESSVLDAEGQRIAIEWAAEAVTYSPEVKNAFALLCKTDWAIDSNAAQMTKALRDISNREPVTIERLRAFYTNWYRCDFRGVEGKPPKPRWVAEHWVEYTDEDCEKGQSSGTYKQAFPGRDPAVAATEGTNGSGPDVLGRRYGSPTREELARISKRQAERERGQS
jgi:hypothetical protein